MEKDVRQTPFDRFLPWVLGGAVAVIAWLSGNGSEFPPELWDDVAVAAGIRPPPAEFPLLWHAVLGVFTDNFGIAGCVKCLKFLGPLSLGLLAAAVFRLFAGYIPAIMKSGTSFSRWDRWVVRSVIIQGAVMFVCSEPVWLAGRVFSPEMFSISLTVLVLLLALLAYEKSSYGCLICMGALSGVLTAENPFAFFIPLGARFYMGFRYSSITDEERPLLSNPLIFAVAMRRTALAFVLCFVAAVSLNIAYFIMTGGGGETNVNMFVTVLRYPLRYFDVVKNAMLPMGWFFAFAAVVLPLVLVMVKSRRLTDTRNVLSVHHGCFLAAVGLFAFLQFTGFSSFHFWKWSTSAVFDRYMLCLCMLGLSVLVMNVLSVFAVDVFYRNYARLLREMFVCDEDGNPSVVRTLTTFKTTLKMLRFPSHAVPLVVFGLIIPFRFDSTVKEMSSIVNDIALNTSRECADAQMIVSDGSYDAAVEVASAMEGGKLKALSLMSGRDKYDVALRLRGETNEVDVSLLEIGAAEAVKTWVNESNARVRDTAFQIGFELWRKNGTDMPEIGGFVAKTSGLPNKDTPGFVAQAHSLAERIVRLYEKKNLGKAAYFELNNMFVFGQWRLSRMCRMRANNADRSRDSELSGKETALADELDRLNPEWQKVQDKMAWIGRHSGMRLTPREGLRLGLERADFRMAGAYARRVIAVDPDDMDANFALGMGFFIQKLYDKAEMHLKKCLIRAPKEPAVLNNLAVVQLRLDKLDEAETNAVKALEHFPDSHEIKATLRHIEKARKELKR